MKSAMLLAPLALAEGGSLKLAWKDCGAAHGKVTGLSPLSLPLGQTTTVTGTGTVDEAVSGGTFEIDLKASIISQTFKGDLCTAKAFNLPLGTGAITWDGLKCPVASGAVNVPTDVQLSSSLPAPLQNVQMTIKGADTTGADVFCMQINTSPAGLANAGTSFEEIVADINNRKTTWTAAMPEKFGLVEDVKPYLGAFLPGDERYEAPPVAEIVVNDVIPDSFDARTQWPKCTVIADIRDQSACGSCWAFGSVDSFQDRACVATGKDIKYSAEDTAFCSSAGMGCNGGNSAWSWFKNTGVVTGGDYTDIGKGDTCYPYSLAPCAHHVPGSAKYPKCPSAEYPSPRCARACSEKGYSGSYSGDKKKASKAYSIRGVEQIQTEIMNNGPAYVAFLVFSDFPTYKSGVYQRHSMIPLGGHAVEAIGWGTENGTPYWLIKNSWNEQWGLNGTFKILRGKNACGIESGVVAGTISTEVVV